MSKKHQVKPSCPQDCRYCNHLREDVIDGYEGQEGQSYNYCKLGYEVNFLNKNMDTLSDKIFAVYRQLNTQVGSILDKDNSVPKVCKKAGLSVVENKKVVEYLKSVGFLKVTGTGAGTKYQLLQKIDVETNVHVIGAIDYKGPKALKQPKPAVLPGEAKAKQYFVGQEVYTIANNCIVTAIIVKQEVLPDVPLDKINNSTIKYTLVQSDGTAFERDVYSFSDSLDSLLNLLKLKFNGMKK